MEVAKSPSQVEYNFLTSEVQSIMPDIQTKFNGPAEAFGLFSNGEFGVSTNGQPDPGALPLHRLIDVSQIRPSYEAIALLAATTLFDHEAGCGRLHRQGD